MRTVVEQGVIELLKLDERAGNIAIRCAREIREVRLGVQNKFKDLADAN